MSALRLQYRDESAGGPLRGPVPTATLARTMATIVQKYGGTSVGDADRIRSVARRIVDDSQRTATRSPPSCPPWASRPTISSSSPPKSAALQLPQRDGHAAHRGRADLDGAAGHGDSGPRRARHEPHRLPGGHPHHVRRTAKPRSSASAATGSARGSTKARSSSSPASRASAPDSRDVTTLGRGGSDATAVALAATLGRRRL